MRARPLWVLGLAALSGCGASVSHRPAPAPDAGNQGGAWEVVFAGGSGLCPCPGGELARRDVALGYTESCAPDVDWPAPDQPSLDEYRRLYLPRRANEVLYFRSWRERYR